MLESALRRRNPPVGYTGFSVVDNPSLLVPIRQRRTEIQRTIGRPIRRQSANRAHPSANRLENNKAAAEYLVPLFLGQAGQIDHPMTGFVGNWRGGAFRAGQLGLPWRETSARGSTIVENAHYI